MSVVVKERTGKDNLDEFRRKGRREARLCLHHLTGSCLSGHLCRRLHACVTRDIEDQCESFPTFSSQNGMLKSHRQTFLASMQPSAHQSAVVDMSLRL